MKRREGSECSGEGAAGGGPGGRRRPTTGHLGRVWACILCVSWAPVGRFVESAEGAPSIALGHPPLEHVLILDASDGDQTVEIDTFEALSRRFRDREIELPAPLTQRAVVSASGPGHALVLHETGLLREIDWFRASYRQVEDLSALTESATHRTYRSAAAWPGEGTVFVLRTDGESAGGGLADFIDFYGSGTVTAGRFVTRAVDPVAIASGPSGDGSLALYSVASGGAVERYDPGAPGPGGVVLRTEPPGGEGARLVAIAAFRDGDTRLFLLEHRSVEGGEGESRVVAMDTDGVVLGETVVGEVHAAALVALDGVGRLLALGRSGHCAIVNPATDPFTVQEFEAEVSREVLSATGLPASLEPGRLVVIADDRGASHLDAHDMRFLWEGGAIDAIRAVPATPVPPIGGEDWAGSSLASRGDALWQLHVDGRLFRVDATTGEVRLLVDLEPRAPTNNRATYEALTGVEGDPRLFILRSDRPLNRKTGGGIPDVVDTLDPVSGEYALAVARTASIEAMALVAGPPLNRGAVLTGNRPALYILGTDGTLEALDPLQEGATEVLRSGLDGAEGGGVMVSLASTIADTAHLYGLRDRTGGDGTDRVDVFDLAGGVRFGVAELVGTQGVALTGEGGGRLLAISADGHHAVIEVRSASELGVHAFPSGTATHHVAATALLPAAPPAGPLFRRGDVDGNGVVEITDPINNLDYQFLGSYTPPCLDALDWDDNGAVEITDPVSSLEHQFLGGPAPPAPGLVDCGEDPTPDETARDLGCRQPPVNCGVPRR